MTNTTGPTLPDAIETAITEAYDAVAAIARTQYGEARRASKQTANKQMDSLRAAILAVLMARENSVWDDATKAIENVRFVEFTNECSALRKRAERLRLAAIYVREGYGEHLQPGDLADDLMPREEVTTDE
jgi:hypothetical protein